ncbi:FtsW/RodA/SpoVE family cell cycle protein [Thalassoglobus neptunius]|uniref:FtsW/RodA/SpoVE family cell cycle protein n=1 Tax=Thalassoglobus neptunius TaxID=1938619 RepID=UPI001E360D57|nr:FtsW/RodA/SpoVE family cell cycle protein [Thalassoglobus neptunius]
MQPIDQLFLAMIAMLIAVGVLFVDSSSMTSVSRPEESIQLSKHLIFLGIGLVAGFVASIIPERLWIMLAPVIYLATLALLILVLVPSFGHRVNGAQRWIRLGSWSLQPSEIAKLSVPMMVCAYRLRYRDRLSSPKFVDFVSIALIGGLPVSFILLEPDLGTSLFICSGIVLVLFLTGWPKWHFLVAGLLCVPMIVGLIVLHPYQLARINGFIQTWTNPAEAPYQVRQSLTSLGVGGLSGTGLGRGWQKLSFLPEADTDFVFAAVGEELGLLGTLGVVLLWCGLYLTGQRMLARSPACSFRVVTGTTILTLLIFQAAINVAVVTAMVPPKGISHPFLSYGGSNLVMSLFSLGVFWSLTKVDRTAEDQHPTVQERHDFEESIDESPSDFIDAAAEF